MRSSLIPHRSVVSRALSTAREWLCNRRTSRYVVRPSARGEGRGPVAPPVFKTGLSLLVGDGRFDSFPSPPFRVNHFDGFRRRVFRLDSACRTRRGPRRRGCEVSREAGSGSSRCPWPEALAPSLAQST